MPLGRLPLPSARAAIDAPAGACVHTCMHILTYTYMYAAQRDTAREPVGAYMHMHMHMHMPMPE